MFDATDPTQPPAQQGAGFAWDFGVTGYSRGAFIAVGEFDPTVAGEEIVLGSNVGGGGRVDIVDFDGNDTATLQATQVFLSPGQDHDVTKGPDLIQGSQAEKVIADKAYDSDTLIAQIESRGATPVIPARSNRTQPRNYAREEYKKRNVVERGINVLKQCRRVATRYDKSAMPRKFTKDELLGLGAEWLLEKPFDFARVGAELKEACG